MLLDPARLRERLALSPSATVVVMGQWSTSLSTYVLGRGPEVEVSLGRDQTTEVEIDVSIRGTEAGGTIELHTQMILLEEPDPRPGGPRLPGSILFESSEKRVLESPGSRLPVCVVDFADFPIQFPSQDAAWALQLTAEALDQPPSVGMQVYLNAQHPELVQRLSREENSPEAVLLRRFLVADIGRQLVQHGLRDEIFTDTTHVYPSGSLGDALRRRVRLLFPDASLEEAANLAMHDIGQFEIAVQGGLLKVP